MTSALWIAKTGLDAQQMRMSVITNNLANVSTTGFKRGRAQFEDLLYQNVRQVGSQTSQNTTLPSGLSLGAGVRITSTAKIFTQGNLTPVSYTHLDVYKRQPVGSKPPLRDNPLKARRAPPVWDWCEPAHWNYPMLNSPNNW